jgi:hypothetical protein
MILRPRHAVHQHGARVDQALGRRPGARRSSLRQERVEALSGLVRGGL